MEKKTSKKRKSRRLKKRIGIIAVGGLSLVLTICLSVGATLAWFAGDTWASKSMYMGGPVYIEMAGETGGDGGTGTTNWVGGEGNLDIHTSATRATGTVDYNGTEEQPDVNPQDVLLPGQRVEIYSQARVFSTGYTNTVADNVDWNSSSGANTANTSNGTVSYYDGTGRVTTATTSVVRARFSIDVEFDPSVGFNNFTNEDYMAGYPKQSTDYAGFNVFNAEDIPNATYTVDGTVATGDGATAKVGWKDALLLDNYELIQADGDGDDLPDDVAYSEKTTANGTRRDGINHLVDTHGFVDTLTDTDMTNASADNGKLLEVRAGTKKSIYKWKYCTKDVYEKAADKSTEALSKATTYMKMGYPFNGKDETNATAYYGVYILDSTGTRPAESDAFYKARCSAYLQTYVEYYENSYGNISTRTIGDSLTQLDTDLNDSFKELIWKSSDSMIADETYKKGDDTYPSWLYVDPKIGNDTNTDEISTSVGGWWYLVESDDTEITKYGNGDNTVYVQYDIRDDADASKATTSEPSEVIKTAATASYVSGQQTEGTIGAFNRDDKVTEGNVHDYTNTSEEILYAKLYEMIPDISTETKVGKNGDTDIIKVVSFAVPFVNGAFSLPGKSLTNIFANAKLTFKISFQALQAFFPYTQDIDGTDSDSKIQGLEKALNIKNAIPIYNEAFDY